MPTTITATVGVARDYLSLQAAYDDIGVGLGSGTNLVANDEEIIIELHADAIYRERVTFDRGLTADATRRVTIRPASGDAHSGVIATNKLIFAPSTGTGHIFTVLDDFIVFEGLQIVQLAAGGSSDEAFRLGNSSHTAEGTTIDKCLIYGSGTTADQDGLYAGNWSVGSAANPILVRDCAIWGWGRGAIHAQLFNQANKTHYWQIVNCITTESQFGIGYRIGIASSTVDLEIVNTITFDNTSANFGSTGPVNGTLVTTGSSNNFDTASLAANIPGDGTPNPISVTDNVDPGAGDWAIFGDISGAQLNRDFSLVDDADNDVLDQGVGPASNSLVSTTDAAGNSRSGATADPGPVQTTGVGGGSPVTEDASVFSAQGSIQTVQGSLAQALSVVEASGSIQAATAALTDSSDVLQGQGAIGQVEGSLAQEATLFEAQGSIQDASSSLSQSSSVLEAQGSLGTVEGNLTQNAEVLESRGAIGGISSGATELADAFEAAGEIGTVVGALGQEASVLEAAGAIGAISAGTVENLAAFSAQATIGAVQGGLTEQATVFEARGSIGDLGGSQSENASALEAAGSIGEIQGALSQDATVLEAQVQIPTASAGVVEEITPLTASGEIAAVQGALTQQVEALSARGTIGTIAEASQVLEDATPLAATLSSGEASVQFIETARVVEARLEIGQVAQQDTVTENLEVVEAVASLQPIEAGVTENVRFLSAKGFIASILENEVTLDPLISVGEILDATDDVAQSTAPALALGQIPDAVDGISVELPAFEAALELPLAEDTITSGVVENLEGFRAFLVLSEALDYEFLVANTQRIYAQLYEIINEGPYYHVNYDTKGKQTLVSNTPVSPANISLNEVESGFGDSRIKRSLRYSRQRWGWIAYIDFDFPVTVEPFENKWLRNPKGLPRDENNDLDAVLLEFERATYLHPALQGPEAGTSFELRFLATPLEG